MSLALSPQTDGLLQALGLHIEWQRDRRRHVVTFVWGDPQGRESIFVPDSLAMTAKRLLPRRGMGCLIRLGCCLLSLGFGLVIAGCSDSHRDQVGHGEDSVDAGSDHDHEGHDHSAHTDAETSCPDVGPLSSGAEVRSKEGLFTVRLVAKSPEIPQKGENAWTLVLLDDEGKPTSDATLANVQPFMPEHGHDGRFAPEIGEGNTQGTFVIERINLWMGGRWEVRVFGVVAGIEDVAVLEVCIAD